MVSRADAVVIGGGIIGASIAYFLTKLGFGQVVLVEKSEICSGATRYSAAHVRLHYSNEVAIRLAVRALEMFTNPEEEFGAPTGFVRCGYLVIVDEEGVDGIRRNVPLQQSLCVETSIVTPDEIASLFPELSLQNVALGAYEPTSGYANPLQTVQTLVSSARALGAKVYEHTPVLDITMSHGSVDSVVTTEGEIATPVVVNAAGPWANRIAAMVGGEYSLRLSREEEAIFELPLDTERLPIVSDAPGRVYFRPSGPGNLLAGFGYPKELQPCDPDTVNDRADPESVERLAEMLVRRFPAAGPALSKERLSQATVGGYAGVYSITDDWYPIVGQSKWVDGFYEAVGGSGHSFKLGPPIAEALAHLIADRTSKIDISALSHSRFQEGKVFSSVWGGGNRA